MAVNDFPTLPAFPYTKMNELNLDWLIEELQNQAAEIAELDARVTALEGGGD